jgi:uncharacterized protein YraI
MSVRRLIAIAATGLGIGLGATSVAHAYAAYTTGAVNVRTGPSTGYQKITALQRGTPVDVRFCQPSWCQVAFWGGAGWVSSNYLTVAGPGYVQPGPGFYFGFGTPPRRWPPSGGPFFNPWPDQRPPWW